jgi:hypothetical protein
MNPILKHAHGLVYTLLQLMPTAYQQQNLQALLGLFFQAQGQPLPAYSTTKSPSALSRFLNESSWSTRAVIVAIRAYILSGLLGYCPVGCRPWLQVIVDLTTLEKRGKFKAKAIVAVGVAGQARCAFGCPLSSRWASSASPGVFESIGAKALALPLS